MNVAMNLFGHDPFLFGLGIFVGLVIDLIGRFSFESRYRPKLSVDFDGLWPVQTQATVPSRRVAGLPTHGPINQPFLVDAYRFKVVNQGRRAAENVHGTLEFTIGGNNLERRVCWYEGIDRAAIDINAHDHTFLDVYGVLNPGNTPVDVVMPTEHDWNDLPALRLVAPLKVRIRVTAKNAKPEYLDFSIDSGNGQPRLG